LQIRRTQVCRYTERSPGHWSQKCWAQRCSQFKGNCRHPQPPKCRG